MSAGLILYAEDDESDAFLLDHAFRRAGIEVPLHVVADGREAIAYLEGQGPFADRERHPLPLLLLLDLKMPAVNGFEVLQWIAGPPPRVVMPAVVLSSSGLEQDREKARRLGAAAYYVKPGKLDEMVALARALKNEWLK